MRTQEMIVNLKKQLEVLNQLGNFFEEVENISDCWCKCHAAWNGSKKSAFIESICKSLEISGQERKFSLLIDSSIMMGSNGTYPECLNWDSLLRACLKVKECPNFWA